MKEPPAQLKDHIAVGSGDIDLKQFLKKPGLKSKSSFSIVGPGFNNKSLSFSLVLCFLILFVLLLTY